MTLYEVVAYYGSYEDSYKIRIGIWQDEKIAEYEKELYIRNVNLLLSKLKIYEEEFNSASESEQEILYNNTFFYKRYDKYLELKDFKNCKINSIEIDKKLVDNFKDYHV